MLQLTEKRLFEKAELGSTLRNMLPQLATLTFVAWQVEHAGGNTGNDSFNLFFKLNENVARITLPH